MHFLVLGINHRTAPLELRERVSRSVREGRELIRELLRAGIPEVLVLSTCNRVEVYGAGRPLPILSQALRAGLHRLAGIEPVGDCWYLYQDADAVRHLFRVAAGLDSMVLGEPEVLGQVKAAVELSREEGGIGVFLSEVAQRCFATAKRVRTETQIGAGSVSLASITYELCRERLAPLEERSALLVGTGEIAEQVAAYLQPPSVRALYIVSRSPQRAAQFASRYRAQPVAYTLVSQALSAAEIVVTASDAPHPIFSRREGALFADRPRLIVDLGHPRNVDPALGELPTVTLYAMDDLQTIVEENLGRRRQEAPQAEAIVAEEVAELASWHASRPLVELIKAFRAQYEELRQKELERLRPRLTEEQYQAVEEVSRRLLAKFLHRPTTAIRSLDPQDQQALRTIRRLFGLPEETPSSSED
ncbi:MAG: glutamyl-tRNA reductase [Candidatus Poribacteria bacterium]|nr:MAG: glutamyl-tRNA reductase [Candidatus Poribacteria bacterium]